MIIDVLQLPQLVMPVATITLGWPDEEPPPWLPPKCPLPPCPPPELLDWMRVRVESAKKKPKEKLIRLEAVQRISLQT